MYLRGPDGIKPHNIYLIFDTSNFVIINDKYHQHDLHILLS